MAVTDSELAAILDHCRSLIDAADQFEHAARARADRAIAAMRAWDGPHRDEFDFRFRGEADDLGDRVRRLRVEADAWAQVWADTVNETNRRRREDAVERISASRGVGESFVDLFVGDDSDQQVRDHRPVSVPLAVHRYAATGGLERF